MRRVFVCLSVVAAFLLFAQVAAAQSACVPVKIQSGGVVDTVGNPVTTGYDKYGYNYIAHMFNGLYENADRPEQVVQSGPVKLIMKWSDDWLANVSCTADGKLARGYDAKTKLFTGVSQGWLTNHMEGDCETADGDSVHVTYFVKIVYVGPATGGTDPWFGKRIWGVYAIIEEVGEDPTNGVCLGLRGLNRDSLVNPAGFGFWTK